MESAGYDAMNRKNLMLVDDRVFCGVGTYQGGPHADDPDTRAHDFNGYARVDLPCWDAGSMAHELSHTLGAVQYSSPHTSRGGHCIDEWDVMCYSDEPHKPRMRFLCKAGAQDFRLDCGNDDYYAARPQPGSYLARHWNMASSRFLTTGDGAACVDAAFEPDDPYWYDYWKVPMASFAIGTSQRRAFCQESGDTDWVLLQAKRGESYEIATSDLAPGVDTRLVLYRGFVEQRWSGMDLATSNDNRGSGDRSSTITFTATTDGSYLVGVADAAERAGFDQIYRLAIRLVPRRPPGHLARTPSRAIPGATFQVTASEFAAATKVSFWWRHGATVVRLGEKTADEHGAVTAHFRVPRDARPGAYTIEATGNDGAAATASFAVLGDKTKSKRRKPGKHRNR